MDAGRHWLRTVLGAGSVALVLPVALVVAVAATTAFGGAQALRGLSQVFAGPSAPASGAEPLGLESARSVPAIPRGPAHHRRADARRAGEVGSPSAPARHTTSAAPRRSSTAHRPAASPSTPAPSPAPGPGGSTTGSSPPSPPPAPAPSAAHAVGQAVADDAKGLPAPVGGPVGDAAQTVVDLIP